MIEEFRKIIENYFDYKKEDFITKIGELIKDSGTLKKEISDLLLLEETPLYLKELLLLTIKESGDTFYLATLSEFLKRCKNKRLKQIAVHSFSGMKDYKTEKILFELKKQVHKDMEKDLNHVLGILYKEKNIRMLRVLLSERKDKVLFMKAADFFKNNPEKRIIPYIIPLILEKEREIREEILSIMLCINYIDERSFSFFTETLKKLFYKGVERDYLKKLIYTLSFISNSTKREKLISFYKELEDTFGDIFQLLKPYAFLPFKDSRYRLFYEKMLFEGDKEERFLIVKNLPEQKEDWINKILREMLLTRNIDLTKEVFKKLFRIGAVEEFSEEIEKLPPKIKLQFVETAVEMDGSIPFSLVNYFFEEENEEIIGKLLEYLFIRGDSKSKEFFEGIITKNFKTELKREAIKYLTILSQDKESLIKFYKEVVFKEGEEKREEIYFYIVNALKKIVREDKEAKLGLKKDIINLFFTIFEKSVSERTLVAIISSVRELPFCNEKEFYFVKEEFQDKKKQLLGVKEDMSPLLKFMSEVEKEIEKQIAICKKKEVARKNFASELLKLKERKETIINISRLITEFPDLPTEREREFLKKYCLSEIKNPFNRRANKIAMLEIINSLKIKEAIGELLDLYKQNPPDLKNSLKTVLLELGVPEKEFEIKKFLWKTEL